MDRQKLEEYREYKRQTLERAKKIVIKVGSAVLTGANGLDPRVINRLADEISLLMIREEMFFWCRQVQWPLDVKLCGLAR